MEMFEKPMRRCALSNTTRLASAGHSVFSLLSAVSLIFGMVRLLPAMCIYVTDGFDMTRAGEGFAPAMACLIVSLMSHKGAVRCLETQRRCKQPE